ncbi:MAG: hypothetical protein AAF978_10705 [Cyanobacteria bacterium P01_E01_bin.48]
MFTLVTRTGLQLLHSRVGRSSGAIAIYLLLRLKTESEKFMLFRSLRIVTSLSKELERNEAGVMTPAAAMEGFWHAMNSIAV